MSWSSTFLSELAKPTRSPVWILESVVAGSAPIGTPVKFASAPGFGDYRVLGLRGVRVQGQTLSPSTWTTTVGAFTVDIVGDSSALFQEITRGTLVVLKMGFAGWLESDFETIAVGQVYNIRGVYPGWQVECRDLFAALRTRLTTTAGELALFHELGGSVTLTSGYTAGDATINLSSTGTLNRETGADGAAIVTADDGSQFVVRYTGKTATTITGCSVSFATVDADAASGNAVNDAALLSGHPMNVVRRILSSSSGTGVWDDYPASWGIGLPDFLIDHDDIEVWRDQVVVPSSGSWSWDLVVTEPQDDPLGWLQSQLAEAGLFLAIRQGKITVRAAQSSGFTTYTYHTNLTITDEDIAEVLEWEAWDSDTSVEYATVTVSTYDTAPDGDGNPVLEETTSSAENPATLPAAQERVFNLAGKVWSNRSAVRSEVLTRVKESCVRVPERVRLRLVPLSWAQLAPGDPVFLTTTRVYGRYDGGAYDGRGAIVVEVSPDYVEGYVDVALLVYPNSGSAFAS